MHIHTVSAAAMPRCQVLTTVHSSQMSAYSSLNPLE